MQYGTNIAGFVSNHNYVRFVVPEGYKPNVYQVSAGIIVSGNWQLANQDLLHLLVNWYIFANNIIPADAYISQH